MEEVKGGITKVTKAVAKGTGTLIKTTKLTISLHSEESKLKSLYVEIGKKVHEIYDFGGSLGEFFDAKYQDILEVQGKIAEIKTKIDLAKGMLTCANCGKTSPDTSVFCPKCGENMNTEEAVEVAPAQPPAPSPPPRAYTPPAQLPPPAPKGKKCGVCGLENEPQERYCLSCGRIFQG